MADTFTRDKFKWLEQVAIDTTLPSSAARLAIVLCSYVNRGTCDAWPSVPTLGARLGIVENAVRKSIKAMVEGGHLEIKAGGGRNATNRYRWLLKPCTEMKGFEAEKPCTEMKGKGAKPCTDVKGLDRETLHFRSLNPAFSFTKPCTKVHPNNMKETSEETSEEKYKPSLLGNRKRKAATGEPDVRQILEACVCPQTASDLIDHRKAKRAPFTPKAAQLLVEAFNAYGAPEAAAAEMIARGWTGFKPEWMRGSSPAQRQTPQGNSHVRRELGRIYDER